MGSSATTRAEEVFTSVRAELLNGAFAPGQRLRLLDLTDRFDVSQSVVREALTRLSEQGLVVAHPQRGFRVRELSIDDMTEITEARVEIESRVLRLAIERGDLNWESRILSTYHLLARTPSGLDDGRIDETWTARHADFHHALIAGCGNARLTAVAQGLRDSAELYRCWSWLLADDHHRDIAREHEALKDLTLARNADDSVALLVEHIERAPKKLVAYAREHGVSALYRASQPSA